MTSWCSSPVHPREREEALQMQEKVGHPRFRSFAGMHKLKAITALYNVATVLVTNDSGPAHFSAITPIRSIVLFGPETPKLYGSLGNTEPIWAALSCSPCVTAANQKNSACNDAVCMRDDYPRARAGIRARRAERRVHDEAVKVGPNRGTALATTRAAAATCAAARKPAHPGKNTSAMRMPGSRLTSGTRSLAPT